MKAFILSFVFMCSLSHADFVTATEAKKETAQTIKTVHESNKTIFYKEIEDDIENAIKNEKCSTWHQVLSCYEEFVPSMVKKLQKLGYRVDVTKDPVKDSIVYINWCEAK
jgi:hypothetical protein